MTPLRNPKILAPPRIYIDARDMPLLHVVMPERAPPQSGIVGFPGKWVGSFPTCPVFPPNRGDGPTVETVRKVQLDGRRQHKVEADAHTEPRQHLL